MGKTKNKSMKKMMFVLLHFVLFAFIGFIFLTLIRKIDDYSSIINNIKETSKNIDNETSNEESTQIVESENIKQDEKEEISNKNKQEEDKYYYFSFLDENERVLFNTSYINDKLPLFSNNLPAKMVLHVIDGNKVYTSSFQTDKQTQETIIKKEAIIVDRPSDPSDAIVTYNDLNG